MNQPQQKADLIHEIANNKRYLELCRDKSLRNASQTVAMPANAKWTQSGLPTGPGTISHPVVGRIQLSKPTPLLDTSTYYIGPMFIEDDGLTVVSWAAPIASTFFDGDQGKHELCADVSVRRTLQSSGYDIVGITDEPVEGRDFAGRPFAEGQSLQVPPPPAAPERPATSPITSHFTPAKTELDAEQEAPQVPEHVLHIPSPREPTRSTRNGPIRAEGALLASLAAPRSARLTTVLATLQPDQYALVTRPANSPLIVQGHPGTGKTIIAAHRAAYLASSERDGGAIGRVLLVGPSAEYARHVEGVVRVLDPQKQVVVRGLTAWMLELTGLLAVTDHTPYSAEDVAWWVGTLCEEAVGLLKASEPQLRARRISLRTLERVFQAVRMNSAGGTRLTNDPKQAAWAKQLPTFQQAVKMRRYLPFFAACALAIQPVGRANAFDHVIVDEAQDLPQLEWRLLHCINTGHGWTLVGDMNQRGGDSSIPGWRQVAALLRLNRPGELCQLTELHRGYRSTLAIMRYATQLLPKAKRSLESLQSDGPQPTVVRVSESGLADRAVAIAGELKARYSTGTVAVIAMEPRTLIGALRQAGWNALLGSAHGWSRGDEQINLYTPEAARGLEFDAVLVVEPAAFPLARGTNGPLYTSLTRANRELRVVHSQTLPAALRRKAMAMAPR